MLGVNNDPSYLVIMPITNDINELEDAWNRYQELPIELIQDSDDACIAKYGVNNQTVSINDCLYLRIFNTEHEEGELIISASTISNEGRKTEKTIFKIKASDWDKLTHTIYLRYQPKEQRGLGVSFSIDSPFNISAIGIGSQTDAILIDKVSKKAINNPQITSNNVEW